MLGEVDEIDLVASRRLQLAAETRGVTGLLLRPPAPRPIASAAVTRWRLAGAPSQPAPSAPAPPRWRVELARCRGGRPGRWLLEWRQDRLTEVAESTAAADDQRSATTRLRPMALAS